MNKFVLPRIVYKDKEADRCLETLRDWFSDEPAESVPETPDCVKNFHRLLARALGKAQAAEK